MSVMDISNNSPLVNLVNKWVLAVFLHISFSQGVGCLKITDLKVPKHVNVGQTVTLECNFELARSNLYSLKWYKDDFEFFRYMPGEEAPFTTFKVPGIDLNISRSGRNRITINDVSYQSSGTYKCEVSTEAPDFNTSLQSSNMTVLAFPDHPPIITGIQETYAMTEYILANCSSAKSNPAPRIVWYIDDKEPDTWAVSDSGPIPHHGPQETPLYSLQSSLQYPASKINGTKEEVLINCTAYVGDMPPSSTTVLTRVLSASANQQLSQEWLHNTGTRPADVAWCLLLLLPCILAAT